MTYPVYCPALTRRENDVMPLLDTWLTYDEIGTKLSITVHTVKCHVRAIYWKFGVTSRREAVERAHQMGLL